VRSASRLVLLEVVPGRAELDAARDVCREACFSGWFANIDGLVCAPAGPARTRSSRQGHGIGVESPLSADGAWKFILSYALRVVCSSEA
jgi:hypothetical protein